ncbi:hypothetical protein [Pseudomonas sp. HLS-6 TE3448]
MNSLWSLLFKRQPERYFARLDGAGLCQAFKHCTDAPIDGHWVEINEIRLHWLNRPLPTSAKVMAHSMSSRPQRTLAA